VTRRNEHNSPVEPGPAPPGAPAEPVETVSDHLARLYPAAKRQTLKRMVEGRRVSVSGRVASRLGDVVKPGETVTVEDRPNRPAAAARPDVHPLSIVHEDADVLVVDKPPGLLTSTVPRERRATALAIVRAYVKAADPRARVGLIHRLDRDASGLLVFSKTDAAYKSLKAQFFHHTVERVYEAVVHGWPEPKSGRIESRLIEFPDGTVRPTRQHDRGALAVTEYEVLEQIKGTGGAKRARVRVTLGTGRKHQVRVHLRERGWPIVGDAVYGPQPHGDRLMLRAVRLAFDHPENGARLTFNLS
jgi:23S rRNA pseudouridine1911/1915/1917 synthase